MFALCFLIVFCNRFLSRGLAGLLQVFYQRAIGYLFFFLDCLFDFASWDGWFGGSALGWGFGACCGFLEMLVSEDWAQTRKV